MAVVFHMVAITSLLSDSLAIIQPLRTSVYFESTRMLLLFLGHL